MSDQNQQSPLPPPSSSSNTNSNNDGAPFLSDLANAEYLESLGSPRPTSTTRRMDIIPASPIDGVLALPGATPPSTMTEPLFGTGGIGGSSISGLPLENYGFGPGNTSNTPMMQIDQVRRAFGRNDLGAPLLPDSDAEHNSTSARTSTQAPPGVVTGMAMQQTMEQLSIAASNPHQINNALPPSSTGAIEATLPSNERVRVIWGTNIIISDAIAAFKGFLRGFTLAHRKMADARSQGPDAPLPVTSAKDLEPFYPRLLEQIHATEIYNLNVDCANLCAYPQTFLFAKQLLHYPVEMVQLMDMVVNDYYKELYPETDNVDPIQVRPFNIGRVVNMRELDPSDLDKLIAIKGLVIRVSNIIPDMRVAYFVCSVCGQYTNVENIRGNITEPTVCPREDCRARHSMAIVHNRCLFSDKQLIKVQETPDAIPDGQTPHCVTLCVYDTLVDVARPGDRVEVTGIFRSAPVRVNPRQRKVKSLFRTFIDVVHLKRMDADRLRFDSSMISSEDYMVAYDETDELHGERNGHNETAEEIKTLSTKPDLYSLLGHSIAPSVWGLDNIKKGLLLQLFSGVSKTLRKCGTARFRGDINILLAGDPGVSKSQLLQYVHKLAPRGIYTSGKGSSAVGLTAYITRDAESNQLVLESGALVLSDGGICCIDEFDKMSDETRTILHEVMEQQTVSIAKAGIITTLNARTSILASANPIESKYNASKSIVENLNLPPTILSRFDVIYLILDNVSMEDDQRLGRHIVSLYTSGGAARSQNVSIDVKLLTKYISYARNIQPTLSEEASRDLANGYVSMRKVNGAAGKTVSATTRQLESLIRLSEAHARMRLSNTVESQDVAEAIRLVREAMLSYAIDPLTGKIDMDLITTGKSSALRERQADLKRQVKSMIIDKDIRSIEFATLVAQITSQSSISVNEKWLRDVVEELVEEEFFSAVGSVRRGVATLTRL